MDRHYPISVNYDEPDAISRMVERNHFDKQFGNMKLLTIPPVGTGQLRQEVYEVYFGEIIMGQKTLFTALKQRGIKLGFKSGFKFCDVLTALQFALTFPDKQREYPIAIVFNDAKGQPRGNLRLYEIDGGRYVQVEDLHSDDGWNETERFLSVPEK